MICAGAKLKKITQPNGYWESFEYETDTGWLKKRTSPYQGQTKIEEYSYDESLSEGEPAEPERLVERPRKITAKVAGTTVGIDFFAYDGNVTTHKRGTTSSATWSSTDNLTTTTTRNAYGPPSRSTPLGSYSNSASLNDDQTELTVDFTTPSQSGSYAINAQGATTFSETIADGLTIAKTESETDSFGRITKTAYLDGTTEEFKNYCVHGPKLIVDREGDSRSLDYFDSGLVKSESGPLGTTTYEYDALGDQTEVKATRLGKSRTETFKYDAMGRLTEHKIGSDATNYAYNANDPGHTVTYPNNTTRIVAKNLDGSISSITGTAVHPTTYQYGVDSTKGRWTKFIQGDSTTDKPWTKTYYNLLGDACSTETSSGYATNTTFDAKGRPKETTDSEGRTTTLTYNAKNEVTKTIQDGVETTYTYTHATRDGETTRKVASVLKTSDGDVTTVAESTIDGLKSWDKINGKETTVSTTRLGGGKYDTTVTSPNGTTNISSTRTQSEVEKVGVGTVTTEFNGFGDATKISDDNGYRRFVYKSGTSLPIRTNTSDFKLTEFKYEQGETQPATIITPNRDFININYEDTGEISMISGTAPGLFKSYYDYDDLGNLTKITTYGDGGPRVTEFEYDEDSGLLERKIINSRTVREFTYHDDGRVETITKPIDAETTVTETLTYTAAPKFHLSGRSFDDGATPSVTVSGHNTFGQPGTIATEGVCSRSFTYDSNARITGVNLTSDVGDDSSATYAYDAVTRQSMTIDGHATTYAYDAGKRLQSITTDDGIVVTFAYVPGSTDMIAETTITLDGSPAATRSITWDAESRTINDVIWTNGSGQPVASFTYERNESTDQITKITRLDNSSVSYAYDDRGQLITVTDNPPSDSPSAGQATARVYVNDSIANVLSGGLVKSDGSPEFSQTCTLFNSIQTRTVGGTIEITGSADAEATITVNDVKASRDGDAFIAVIDADNETAANYLPVEVTAVKFDPDAVPEDGQGEPGADLVTTIEFEVFTPKAEDDYDYDLAGRLKADSVQSYEWDAEDRLTAVETKIGPDGVLTRVQSDFDAGGRRVRKQVFAGTPGDWILQETRLFFYDVVLLDGSPADFGLLTQEIIKDAVGTTVADVRYVWGPDVKNGYQGLGGVGGLFAAVDAVSGLVVVPLTDAKGTVHKLLDARTGDILAEFDYSPYGGVVSRTGDEELADLFPFRFQTKYYDGEIGLAQYGFRPYDPKTAKWLCKDPIAENGGLNLYAFVRNDPINGVDYLGMEWYDDPNDFLAVLGAGWRGAMTFLPYEDANGSITLSGPVWDKVSDVVFMNYTTAKRPLTDYERFLIWYRNQKNISYDVNGELGKHSFKNGCNPNAVLLENLFNEAIDNMNYSNGTFRLESSLTEKSGRFVIGALNKTTKILASSSSLELNDAFPLSGVKSMKGQRIRYYDRVNRIDFQKINTPADKLCAGATALKDAAERFESGVNNAFKKRAIVVEYATFRGQTKWQAFWISGTQGRMIPEQIYDEQRAIELINKQYNQHYSIFEMKSGKAVPSPFSVENIPEHLKDYR